MGTRKDKFTEAQKAEIKELCGLKFTVSQIARISGIKLSTLRALLKRNNLVPLLSDARRAENYEEIKAMYLTNISVEEIAEKFGKTTGAIYSLMANNYIYRMKPVKEIKEVRRRLEEDEKSKAIEDYLNNKPVEEIAEYYGCSKTAIYNLMHAKGIKRRDKKRINENVGEKIKELFSKGYSIKDIAEKVHNSRYIISKFIVKNNLTRSYKLPRIDLEELNNIIDLFINGIPVRQISQKFYRSEDSIYHLMRKNNIRRFQPRFKDFQDLHDLLTSSLINT